MTEPFARRLNQALTALIETRPVDGEAVRVTAATALADLFLEAVARDPAALPAHFSELMAGLLPRISLEARAGIARRLAHSPALPAEIAWLLADDAYEVAGPVLRQSPVLSEADLVAAASGPCPDRARAVAGRSGLSPAVIAALLDRADNRIAAELAERAGDLDGDEASRIALHPDLPPRAADRLAAVPGLTDAALAALFWRSDAAGRRRIVSRIARRREALPRDEADGRPTSPAAALADLLPLAAARRRAEMAARLAEAFDLAAPLARRIVDDPGGEALAADAQAGGLAIDQVTGVVLLTAADPGGSYGALSDLVALAEALEPGLARHLVALWARAEAPPERRRPPARHEPAIAQPGARHRPAAHDRPADHIRVPGEAAAKR